MRRLHFEYYMQIDYTVKVSRCNFTIKCIPKDNARQKIENTKIEVYPPTSYQMGMDGLNNLQIYGSNEEVHSRFSYRITGDSIVGNSDYEEITDDNLDMIFSHPYGLSMAGENIRSYFNSLCIAPTDNALLKAEKIMHSLYGYFNYVPNMTTVNTTAEEAFNLNCGVCQDYSHIFIALLHLAKIPARYVTGLIVGEGASHAWVEVLFQGKWYGFDPTNNIRVGDSHIKIGVGRDAHDCMINRGIMQGGGLHTQTVNVQVTVV